MRRPVYLLVGDPFLAEEALERLRAEEATGPLSEVALDATVEPADLMAALGTASLLGDRRLVVVRDAHDLTKAHAEAVKGYLAEPSPSSVLVLVASKATKLDAELRQAGAIVRLEAPRGRNLVGWIRERGRVHDIRIDDRAGWALLETVGTDLRELDAAVAQLATRLGRGATVAARDVHQVFPRSADERIFAFTDGVGDRKLAVATTSLRRLLEQGEEPLVLFGSLAGHIRRLLRARRYADHGADAVADALGLPPWRAERLQRQARS